VGQVTRFISVFGHSSDAVTALRAKDRVRVFQGTNNGEVVLTALSAIEFNAHSTPPRAITQTAVAF
jgi:hypothetical protein